MKFKQILFFLISIAFTASTYSQSTGLYLDFSSPLDDGWIDDSQYSLSIEDECLRMDVSKVNIWAGTKYVLPDSLDISANPYVTIRLKGSLPFIFHAYITDSVNNTTVYSRVHYSGDTFGEYFFDFSDPGDVDLTKVKEMIFAVNGAALSWYGTIWMDDLKIGDQASKIAGIGAVADITVATNSTSVTLNLTDVKNASALSLSGGDALIENISISDIENEMASISFDCKQDASGSGVLSLTASGEDGYEDYSLDFNLTVEDNFAPVMDAIEDIDAPVGKTVEVELSGISDENTSEEQQISFNITNGDNLVISDPVIEYEDNSSYAELSFTSLAAGTSTVIIEILDNGTSNNSSSYTFDVVVHDNYNYAPSFDIQMESEIFLSEGSLYIPLENISDGGDNSQSLYYSATSLNSDVISNPVSITYIEGNPMQPRIGCNAVAAGSAQIEVTVTDDAPGAGNGNQSCTKTINIDVKEDPFNGMIIYPENFADDVLADNYNIEGQGVSQDISYVNFDGSECLYINCISKFTWSGFWYRTPDLDLTDYPYMSYEVYSVDNDIQTHAYFWDNLGDRNSNGAHAERKDVPANQWTEVLLDFRDEGELTGSDGEDINISRIDTILFNYHPSFGWPFTEYVGELYIRNIRIGNEVTSAPAVTPTVTVNDIPDQSVYANTGSYSLIIDGITAGGESTSDPVAEITFDEAQTVFSSISLSSVNSSGEAELTYVTTENTGSVSVELEVTATGSTSLSKTFLLEAISTENSDLTTISVDLTQTSQTFTGFGADSPDITYIDQFVQDGGGNVCRLGFSGDDIEALNDNSNAFSIDKSGFDYSGLDLDYIRAVHEAGVEQFFVTIFTPPSWMKENLSSNYQQALAPSWESTTNKVDTIYYDEYVEFMIAVVEIIKEETGVELIGICPQNEPAFCEQYSSAILDPDHNAEVCGMLGERLAQKGFSTKVINSEQVFAQSHYSVNNYIDAVQADPLANEYTGAIGFHYPTSDTDLWSSQYANCIEGDYPKEYWGTECSAEGNEWDDVMENIEEIMIGLNNGLSLWAVFGWSQSALFTSDTNPVGDQIGVVYGGTPSKHFYALKNLFDYIQPGAVQVESSSDNASIYSVAFIHEEDSVLSIVLLNNSTEAVKCQLSGEYLPAITKVYRTGLVEDYEETDPLYEEMILLPASSITTLVCKTGINNPPTIDPVSDMDLVSVSEEHLVDLSGISDGDLSEQEISISASVSPEGIITDPQIIYTSPETTGTLSFETVSGQWGTAVITVLVKDKGGVENDGIDSVKTTFTVNVQEPEGIEDFSAAIKCYPNPVSEILLMQFPKVLEDATLSIYNSQGVLVKKYESIDAINSFEIEMSAFAQGLYYIEIQSDKLSGIKKVIKE